MQENICAAPSHRQGACAISSTRAISSRSKRRCSSNRRPRGRATISFPAASIRETFYALPQSPQMLKQILMIVGLRTVHADRALHARRGSSAPTGSPEFTQLDVETVVLHAGRRARDDGVVHAARLADRARHRAAGRFRGSRIKRRSRSTGSISPICASVSNSPTSTRVFGETRVRRFPVGRWRAAAAIVALRYPGGAALSRRDFDALTETAKQFGAKGMVWIALAEPTA